MRFFVLSLAAGMALSPAVGAAQSFETGRSFAALEHPNAVAVADMNGDGRLDLVVPSWSPNRVAIYLGDGAGGFGPAVTYPTGTGPRFVTTADFNNDGFPDVATANSDSADVSIFLNSGTGTILARPRLAAGTTAFHVAAGDLDADGNVDLTVSNAGAGTVSVYRGDGTGAFTAAGTLSAGSSPHATAMADFDQDGHTDLAVADYGSGEVWVFPGDGSGGFGSPSTHPVGTSPFTLAAADLDGDGRADLAVPNFGSNTVSVLRNDGSGGFLTSTMAVGRSPRAVISADFDADGRPDLAVANRDGNTVSILLGDGTGAFTSAGRFGTGAGPFHLAAGDLDGDGVLDVVVPDRDSYSVTVLRGASQGRFHAPTSYAAGTGPRGIASGDLDGDGLPDLVTVDVTSSTASVLRGTGPGTVGTATAYAVAKAPYAVALGDFDEDGRLDIASASSSANKVSLLRADGTGGFLPAVNVTAGSGPRALVAADLNQDGHLDVATANYNASTVAVLFGNGSGALAAPVVLAAGANPVGIAAADFDGDGRLDLASANATSNNVSVFLSTGPGTFGPATAFAAGVRPSAVAAGDLDGDGQADLAVANETSNTVSVLLGDGGGGFVALAPLAVGPRPLAIVLHEITGDAHLDVAVACATSNTLSVAAGRGDGTFDPPVSVHAGWFPRALAVADFDGDGRPDLAAGNGTSNDAWIALNRSGKIADLALSVGNGAGSVVAGAPVSYAATVTNIGPSPVSSVVLDLSLPEELQDVVYAPSAGAFDDTTGEWTGLDLIASGSATLTVSGVVAPTAAGSIEVGASVAPPAGTIDPAGANNQAADVDPVIRGDADLTVAISDGVATVSAGDPVAYTVVVANAGPTDVFGAGVSTTLPAPLLAAAWTCAAAGGATCAASGAGAVADSADLPAGGQVTYTLQATVDPLAASGTLTVTATVAAPADINDPNAANNAATDSDALQGDAPPVPDPQSLSVPEDGALPVVLTASDPDGDPLTYAIATPPAHGVLSGAPPEVTYTPLANYYGPDSFSFSAHDGIVGATATVSIAVSAVNDPPQAFAQSLTTSEDVSLGLTLGASDVDGDPLTYAIVTAPALGTLTGSGASRTYLPHANASGADSFTFVVSDGQLQSDAATVSVTVEAVNDAPAVVSPLPDLTVEGEATSAAVDLAGVFDDVEAGAASLVLSAASSNPGLVAPSISGTTLTLQLTANQGGSAVVTVRATDPDLAFADDAFQVTVVRPGVRLSVSDASRGEGSSSGVVFTLSLSGPATQTVTVPYQTADGTASAPADYGALSGTVTFAPGVTTRTVKVTTVGDVIDEDDETFTLVLGAPAGATLEDGVGVGTIVDNDTAGLSVLDITVGEGHGGITPATFTVSLSAPSTRDITVDFATVPVSAAPGADYLARSGSLRFPAGGTAAQTVTVDVLGDLIDEANEAFSLQLSNALNAALTRSLARATITDDDDPPTVGITDVSLAEGASGTTSFVFTFTLSGPSAFTTRVSYATADGTAIAGSDYTARSGQVVFSPGVTTMTVAIAVAGDGAVEPDETFFVDLDAPVNLTIADPQGVGTILGDD